MSSTRHSSFGQLPLEDFKTYARSLLDHGCEGPNRERQTAYLRRVLGRDDAIIKAEQTALSARRRLQRLQVQAVEELEADHALDFEAAPELFVDAPKTDAEIMALLTQDNATVYLRGRTLTGNVRITGNNVRLIGLGVTGTAVGGDLACTVQINTDRVQIGGDNIRIEGIKFVTSGEHPSGGFGAAISFDSGKGSGLDLEDCIFESGYATYANARFYYGAGAGAGGNQIIKNCLIKDFGSWYLGDATTTSEFQGSTRVESFTIDACKFDNCAGSFAIRGPATGRPNGTITITNNLIVYGAGGVHQYFWNNFEASEGLSRVICTGNEVQGMVKSGTRGFLQVWSKNPVPYTITFEKNKLSNFQGALQCACGPAASLFYAPNTNDPDYKVASEAGQYTNVDYGAIFTYPWNDPQITYGPVNNVAESSLPATSFADQVPTFPSS